MLKIRLSLLFVLCYQLSFSQNFAWAKSFGSYYSESGNSIVTDTSGNVYTIGVFMGQVDFDPNIDSSFVITSNDYTTDVYISKFNPAGKFIWAKKIGGKGYDEGASIAIDANQNIYITGLYEDSADFDPSAGELILVSKAASQDVFVAKYNSWGDIIWAKSIGGNSFDIGKSICVDKLGNVFVAGYFVDSCDFNPSSAHYFIKSNGNFDAFVLKLNSSGAFQWAKGFGGGNYDIAYSISLDVQGNVYATGQFQDTMIYNFIAPNKLISQGNEDVFIIKFSNFGTILWAKSIGSNLSDIGYSIAIDRNSNVYSTGQFQGTVNFNPDLGNSSLTALKTDIYISKLDSSGNYIWAKSFSGTSNSGIGNGFDINFDDMQNLYVTGLFSNTFDFNTDTPTYILNSYGSSGVFVSKLGPDGQLIWAENYGGMGNVALDVDRYQNIYLTGTFKGNVDFNPGIDVFSLYAGNDYDAYLLKLSSRPDKTGDIIGLKLQCANTMATYSVSPSIGATYYLWDVPDGAVILSGQNTQSIQVKLGNNEGFITVTPYNSLGSGPYSTIAISIKPMNEMGFTINKSSQCLKGNAFIFTDTTSTTNAYRRAWFINNENSTLTSITKTLTQIGKYNIRLIGTNQYYCYDTITKTIEVNPMPLAEFNINNNIQCLKGNTFHFSDLSSISSGETSSNWQFDSKNKRDTSSLKNPTKNYDSAGIYVVRLIAISDKTCKDTMNKIVTINNSPIAGIIAGSSGVNANIIYNYSIKDSVGLTYKWTLSNGLVLSGQGTATIQAKWLSLGSGEVKVEVSNAINCKDISTISIAINKVGLDDISPISDFSIFPNPNQGQFELKFNLFSANLTQISIVNLLGQEVWSSEISLNPGNQMIPIQSNLTGGIYKLRLRVGGNLHSKTLLIN